MKKKNLPKLRVLIVEDNEADLEIAKHRLAHSDFLFEAEVSVARDSEEALNHLRKATDDGSLPDLMLLDLILPGANGLELLKEMKQHAQWHTIPVIVLTVSDQTEHLVRSYKLGGTMYMRKPFKQDLFCEVVMRLKISGVLKT